jgi:hypothetical protein
MKSLLGIIATIIAVVGYVPYIRDTFSGKTKPHVFSWFLWSVVSFIAFGIQITNKGGFGSLANLAMGIICLIIFGRSLMNGTKQISKFDVISLILAIISIILWLIIKQPLLSITLVVIVDLFSFLPTFRKSWINPYQETLITWIMNCVRQILIILSLDQINIINAMYPIYAFIAVFIFWVMLIVRRKKVNPESEQARLR